MSRIIGVLKSKIAHALGAREELVDANGNRHQLAEELGRGGQGAVFRTTNREIAVKLLMDATGQAVHSSNGDEARRMSAAIERVLALPLPASGIAVPIAPLRERVGYTMRLLDGMEPLAKLMVAKHEPATHYRESGGLRRRLELLARLADRLAGLHGLGLVFSDLSPNNVFVSSDAAHAEVWLIDPDNLHYLEHRELRVYTPRYGAPEVVSGDSAVNTLSDCWSFAVIAHELLRMAHPFEGGATESSRWDETEQVIAPTPDSPLVWTDDPEDESNRSKYGRSLDQTATERMKKMFARAFCAGRADPTARPTMSEWSDALWEAVDLAIVCAHCKGSTFVRAQGTHDCCGHSRDPVLRIESRLWIPDLDKDLFDLAQGRRAAEEVEASLDAIDPDRKKDATAAALLPQRPPLATMRVAVGVQSFVPRSLVEPVGVEGRREPAIELKFLGGRLLATPRCDSASRWTWIDPRALKLAPCKPGIDVALPTRGGYVLHLHCGTVDEPHCVITVTLIGGGDGG